MQINLYFPDIKAVSTNHAIGHSVRGGFYKSYKTSEAKEFEKYIVAVLNANHKKDRDMFIRNYDEEKFYLVTNIKFYLPIFVKDMSRLSKKAKDTSNMVKYLEDTIAKFFGYDDSQIIPVNATRIHSHDLRIEYQINLCDLNLIK